jgi:hypothetical protein
MLISPLPEIGRSARTATRDGALVLSGFIEVTLVAIASCPNDRCIAAVDFVAHAITRSPSSASRQFLNRYAIIAT